MVGFMVLLPHATPMEEIAVKLCTFLSESDFWNFSLPQNTQQPSLE